MVKAKRSEKTGVVAFDFDGVIGDSVKECYVQSLAAYGGEHSAVLEKKFREARPLITVVEHFYTVMRMIKEKPSTDFSRMTQEHFFREHEKDTAKAAEFKDRFYNQRREMQEMTPQKWRALQGAFPRMAGFIKEVQRKNHVYIATTKDKKSVMELLKSYGVNIPEENILSRDFSKKKNEQLHEIMRRSGFPPHKVLLIEDSLEQILNARKLGIKTMMVPWGYSNRSQVKEAKRKKVPIIKTTRRDIMRIGRNLRRTPK